MELPRSARSASRLRILPQATSTNDVLVAAVAAAALERPEPHLSTVLTLDQTAGRGRLGRVWVARPGKTVAVSVLVRPILESGDALGAQHFGWLALIAGLALAEAIDNLVGDHRTGLKWPNDVQIDSLKVSGVLAELLPAADAVVIGAGINLTLGSGELPIPTATSLALCGVVLRGDALVDAVVGAYLERLSGLLTDFLRVDGDASASGILSLVTARCSTLGREVRVEIPGGADLIGVATGVDRAGQLVVRRSSDGVVVSVAAGDVTHLRYE